MGIFLQNRDNNGIAKKLTTGDLCKTPPFAQFRRQTQILILKIRNVFLWLKFSPFLALNKIERFAKVSQYIAPTIPKIDIKLRKKPFLNASPFK